MTDRLAPFGQAVLAVRWGALAISLALASPDLADSRDRLLPAFLLLAVSTAFRTVRPLRFGGGPRGELHLLVEAAIAAGAVVVTGYGDSPLVFALLVPPVLGGFAGGFRMGGAIALTLLLAVVVPWVALDGAGADDLRASADWAGETVLVAFVAGFARRISGEADERRDAALDRLGRLADANVLLFQLHQVTQTLPASLDLTEVLDATVVQLRELFQSDGVAIVLHEESDGGWHTVRRHALQVAPAFPAGALPPPLARAVAVHSAAREDDVTGSAGPGLDPASGSGLYGVLTARGATIGVVALEHRLVGHFTDRDVELLSGFVDAAALAIDNARWFGRLRTVGADEERSRIAKDLHDRTGQSLAYLAFELDRITKKSGKGVVVTDDLDVLRGDVRKVVGEVRDTLYDLRTDVTESDGMASTLSAFLVRVQERSGLTATLEAEETARLPLPRERELWRIAREVVTHVERHAQAEAVVVRWRCDGHRAELEVLDDGAAPGRADGTSLGAPGLAALRERAVGIGATLVVSALPQGGTRVRCTLAG